MGAKLITFVEEFDVGETGEHDHDGAFGELFLVQFAERGNAVIGLHQEVEEDHKVRGRAFCVGIFKIGDESIPSFEGVNGIEEFAAFESSVFGVEIGLGVIDEEDGDVIIV